MIKICQNRNAFSLSELMLAMLILSVVLSGHIQLSYQAILLVDASKNLTVAVDEGHSKIEEIRNTDFDSILSTYNSTMFNLSQVTGTGNIAVTAIGADVAADLLEVSIVLTWTNRDKRSVNTTLVSYVAKR